MTVKIGHGRGKKGDGLHVDKVSKKRTYKGVRNINGFSDMQLDALLANPNTRNKDVGKIRRMLKHRARAVVKNWTPAHRSKVLVAAKVAELQESRA